MTRPREFETELERGDPGPIGTIDLSHRTLSGGDTRFMWLLVAGFIVVSLLLFAAIVYGPRPARPHCPDGYALAGGGFAGALHCEPGPPVEWR